MLPSGWIATPITGVVIGVFGIIGNFLCFVVLSHKDMRTPYVYNLRGLAYSDFVLLIIATLRTLDKITPIPDWLIGNSLLFIPLWICNSGTKYFTVAVSFERFIAVTYPIQAHNWVTVKKAKISAFFIFIFCVALAVFSYIYVNYIDLRSYSIWIVVVLHFIPFILVVVFNTFVFIGLRRYRRNRRNLSKDEAETESITRMLFLIVLLFGVCSGIEVIRRIWIFFDNSLVEKPHYEHIINHMSDVFYIFNSSANFVIYYLWGREFRKVFFKVFRCGKKECGGPSSITTEERRL